MSASTPFINPMADLDKDSQNESKDMLNVPFDDNDNNVSSYERTLDKILSLDCQCCLNAIQTLQTDNTKIPETLRLEKRIN
jgi:hypothetical protein